MKIRLEEYCRGARVRLSVDDAPMTVLHALVNHFVMACTDVEEKQEAEPVDYGAAQRAYNAYASKLTDSLTGSLISGDQYDVRVGDKTMQNIIADKTRQAIAEAMAGNLPGDDTIDCTQTEQAPKKRGRPKKVETAPEPVATEAQEEPHLPFESATDSLLKGVAESQNTELTPLLVTEHPPAETPSEPLPEVTDSEMNRYCGKLAQHWGGAEKVYALAQKFVSEGELPRPTRIAGTEARWAFIREAEAATGVKYHG